MVGKSIIVYPVKDGDNFWLPSMEMVDKNFKCFWWDTSTECWIFSFKAVVGSPSLGNCGLKYEHQKDVAKRLVDRGFTSFLPYLSPLHYHE